LRGPASQPKHRIEPISRSLSTVRESFGPKLRNSAQRSTNALAPGNLYKTGCATSRKAAQKFVRPLEIRCSFRLSHGRRRWQSNRASGGSNLRSEMPRSIDQVGQTGSGSDGRVACSTWCYCRKSAPGLFGDRSGRRDISRGCRFSIPRPLTRPGGDSWFVKACQRPVALLDDRPSGEPLDGALKSSRGVWSEDA
jgi:hypothetical protein